MCEAMNLTDARRIRGPFLPAALLAISLLGACGGPSYLRTADDSTAQWRQPSPAREQLVKTAADQIGTPYRFGGNSPRGFDCSGLVQYAHRQLGIEVPRTTASQLAQARDPQRRHLLPGDLLFFAIGRQKERHVGIYEGEGLFIHAPSSGKRVSRASLDNPYWRSRLIARRTFL